MVPERHDSNRTGDTERDGGDELQDYVATRLFRPPVGLVVVRPEIGEPSAGGVLASIHRGPDEGASPIHAPHGGGDLAPERGGRLRRRRGLSRREGRGDRSPGRGRGRLGP